MRLAASSIYENITLLSVSFTLKKRLPDRENRQAGVPQYGQYLIL